MVREQVVPQVTVVREKDGMPVIDVRHHHAPEPFSCAD